MIDDNNDKEMKLWSLYRINVVIVVVNAFILFYFIPADTVRYNATR